MAADSYVTTDAFFCATLLYIFGTNALIRVTEEDKSDGSRTVKKFQMAVPSLDADSYLQDYLKGQMAITDARELFRCYSRVTQIMKQMSRDAVDSWESSRWIAGEN